MVRRSRFFDPPEITTLTGITDEMVTGQSIDDPAVDDLLKRVVLIIAHNASFDRRYLERRLPAFATKHWACIHSDIDWKSRGHPLIGTRIRGLCVGVFPRRTSGRERLSDDPPCADSTATRYMAAGIAGSLGTGEIADMAVMGERRRH
jgi:hypothetical protein